jgi:hypothetical protein
MKRFIAAFLTIALILAPAFSATAYTRPADIPSAESEKYDSGSSVSLVGNLDGDILTISIKSKLSIAGGFSAVGLILTYDNAELTLMHKTSSTEYQGIDNTLESNDSAKKSALDVTVTSGTEDAEPYTIANADLYKTGTRTAFYAYFYTVSTPTIIAENQDIELCRIRFKVAPGAVIDRETLRFADVTKDKTVMDGVCKSKDEYSVVLVAKAIGTGSEMIRRLAGTISENTPGYTVGDAHNKLIQATVSYPGSETQTLGSLALSLSPNSVTVSPNEIPQTVTPALTALDVDGEAMAVPGGVSWTFDPPTASAGVIYNAETGAVTVTNAAQSGSVKIKAASGSVESGEQTLTITRPAPVATSASFEEGAAFTLVIPRSGTAVETFTPRLYDQFGLEMADQSWAWSVAEDLPNGVTRNDGTVTVAAAAQSGGFTLTATANGKTASIAITVADIEVTWPDVTASATYTYGQPMTLSTLFASPYPAVGTAAAGNTALAGAFAIKEASPLAAGQQTFNVVFTVTTQGEYHGSTFEKQYNITVLPRESTLAVSVDGGPFAYSGEEHKPTVTVSDGEATLNGDTDYTVGYSDNIGAGTAAVNVTGIGNYLGSAGTATFTIAPKPLTITAATLAAKTYDGTTDATVSEVTFGGAAAALAIGTDYTATAAYDTPGAGTDKTAAVTALLLNGNYSLAVSTFEMTAQTILKATLAPPANAPVYVKQNIPSAFALGALFPLPAGWTYEGADIADGIVTITEAGTSAAQRSVTLKNANYNDVTATIDVTVTEKDIVQIAEDISLDKVYDGLPAAYAGDCTGSFSEASPTNVGDYTLTLTKAEDDSNVYTPQIIRFTISPRPLTVTAGDYTFVRGTESIPTTFAVSTQGFAASEDWSVQPTATTAATDPDETGEFDIIPFGGTLAVPGNYTVTYVNGTLSITERRESTGGSSPSPDSSKTVPASNGAVTVNYTQSGGAVILSLPGSKVTEIISKSAETAVIDLSKVTGATSVNLPKTALAKFAEAGLAVELQLPQGSVALDPNAAASAAAQTAGGNVAISLKSVAASSLNERQRAAVGDAPVYDISVSIGSRAITSFDGGLITIALPYTLKTGEQASGVVVWHLDETGNIQNLETMYDTRTKTVIFTTDHLSLYAIGYDESLATVAAEPWQNPFTDVSESDWFYGDVEYAHTNGLMTGTDANTFSPRTQMTRAMLVTVLHRLAVGDAVLSVPNLKTTGFTDVPPGQWYSDAIAWAAQSGLVTGIGGGLFAPNAYITRQDLAVILYRYANSPAASGSLSAFSDAEAVSDYARDALAWAVAVGIIRGDDSGKIDPKASATRADAAAMLRRFMANQED